MTGGAETEIPERLFRQSDDFKALQVARREQARQARAAMLARVTSAPFLRSLGACVAPFGALAAVYWFGS
jgi:hypothetical protein